MHEHERDHENEHGATTSADTCLASSVRGRARRELHEDHGAPKRTSTDHEDGSAEGNAPTFRGEDRGADRHGAPVLPTTPLPTTHKETRKMDDVCCDAHYASTYGSRQFSITANTRGGVKRFTAEWLPTRCRRTFSTKREATQFVKDHENRCYGKGR